MMQRVRMRALIELICDLTREDGPWIEKRNRLLDLASHDERVYLEEFAAWFEPEDKR